MKYRPALHWFAVFTAVFTFLLIGLGGLVTSNEAGMSVPDWPTSYGYNMFALPIKFWKGGAFYEHTHRLWASFLGVLMVVLMRWLGGTASRKPLAIIGALEFVAGSIMVLFFPELKAIGYFLNGIGGVVFLAGLIWFWKERATPRLVTLGWWGFWLVQLQGLMGGLRVALKMDYLGIPHGAVAQAFLLLICAIALFTSNWWLNLDPKKLVAVPRGLRSHVLYVTILIFVQLVIGATMRHQHAGLAVNTFPLAYGKIWPDTSPAAIATYNADRMEIDNENPITAFQVELHMVHRVVAVLIFLGVVAAGFMAMKRLGSGDPLTTLAWFWVFLLVTQVTLGIATVLTNKAADVATLHVMVGAISLVTGAVWCLVAARRTTLTEIALAGQNKMSGAHFSAASSIP